MAKTYGSDPFCDISINDQNFPLAYEKAKDSHRFLVHFQKCLDNLDPTKYNALIHHNIKAVFARIIEKRKTLVYQYNRLDEKYKADKERDGKLERRIRELEKKLQSVNQDNQKLKENITNLQRDSGKAAQELQKKIASLQKDLNESIQNYDKVNNALSHSVEQTQKLQEDNDELVNQVNLLNQFNGSVQQLRDDIRAKNKELDEMTETIDVLNQDKAKLSEKLRASNQEIVKMTGQIGVLNEEKAVFVGQINELNRERGILNGQVNELNQNRIASNELQQKNDDLNKKIIELQEEKATIIIDYENRLYQEQTKREEMRKEIVCEQQAKTQEVQSKLDKIIERKNHHIRRAANAWNLVEQMMPKEKSGSEPPIKKSKLASSDKVKETPILRSLLSNNVQPVQSNYGFSELRFPQQHVAFNPIPAYSQAQYHYFIPQPLQQPFNASAKYFDSGTSIFQENAGISYHPQYAHINMQQNPQEVNGSAPHSHEKRC